jgi:hypothetical protein
MRGPLAPTLLSFGNMIADKPLNVVGSGQVSSFFIAGLPGVCHP